MRAHFEHKSNSPPSWFLRRVPFPLMIRQRRGTAPYGIFLATVPLHFQSSGRPEWLTPCFGAQSADVYSVLSLASSFRHMTRVANGKRGTARLSPTSTRAAYLRAQSQLFCHIDCGATHSVSKTTRLTSASVWALFRTRTQSRH
jgi:hypothetical protein